MTLTSVKKMLLILLLLGFIVSTGQAQGKKKSSMTLDLCTEADKNSGALTARYMSVTCPNGLTGALSEPSCKKINYFIKYADKLCLQKM